MAAEKKVAAAVADSVAAVLDLADPAAEAGLVVPDEDAAQVVVAVLAEVRAVAEVRAEANVDVLPSKNNRAAAQQAETAISI